ncbi:NAD(P)-dependent oxidoreductase [Methylobacterium sp. NEAU 140]|uniref:NAD-dependent epimerase/dehydratase family protein n=1 Tax=Methylobacterium sp. NEAU 140 TaxID=3064945 RepID=UPI002736B48F|nr:NAD(P)-dependent oxidoreductase [Methylobacterium sp. NEAU 140]MDP4026510.1 NAD(P)-dependent oxidoreductase [Methylobacterium sp. NEAU 140]
MRVLVTGAGDYLGRRLIARLADGLPAGGRILGIAGEPMGAGDPASAGDPALPGVAHRTVDPLDPAALTATVADFDPTVVVHLAALASVAESSRTPAHAWRADLLGSLNLAEAVGRACRGARFVFVSSTEVYGAARAGACLDEAVPPRPCNIFGRTKHACEAILRDVLSTARVRHTVLRPSNYIGPGQSTAFAAPSLAMQIARVEAGLVPSAVAGSAFPPVIEVGDLGVCRDFIDADDVTAACRAAIAADLPDGGVYNVSSGVATPIGAVLDTLRGLARAPFDVRVSPDRLRPSEVRSVCCDASAFAAATGWRPEVPLARSLAAILDDARGRVAV